ncbi:type III-B CRISPR module RAMP protein Cmr4 [candidate division KSB3 bacterium]|uniref:Type III-B CRISPR module RAMP protein Cmr4 n=1 Tax=candidate division KSB3 bacterium TaxID=2044937 RepID=A0A2G6K8D6_9BACT|nr:MAG: type III-B CRISPR module RAMP protein Cmr4 [candidate division KSB3 bacterium]
MVQYEKQSTLLMTVDPVHIGSGGYRLGRVDNAIIREPGTKLPKIPGTSLSGAIRHYAAYRLGKPECAGQGQRTQQEGERKSFHCGTCPVCYTFGSVKGPEQAFAGTVNIFDARILFFPVYSVKGPVWVTTYELLKACHFDTDDPQLDDTEVAISEQLRGPSLNLGWILLNVKQQQNRNLVLSVSGWKDVPEINTIRKRIVLVTEKLFSYIVNSNLEVRTSVSIDPFTGAAESGALFTYEAIPRATVLSCDIVKDDYRNTFAQANPGLEGWTSPLDVVNDGLKLAETLGVGGMGTRGFGRIRKIAGFTSSIDETSGGAA